MSFGLTAYPAGLEWGYITREQAAERTPNALRFPWKAPQREEPTGNWGRWGLFAQFLDEDSQRRWR